MMIGPISTAAGALTHGACIGLFYYYLDWGFIGICWATAMVFVGRTIAAQIYSRFVVAN